MPYRTDETTGTEDTMRRRCLECGDEIPYGGRTDRIYCCDACKSRHNYLTRKSVQFGRAHTLSVLSKNYEILEQLIDKQERYAAIPELMFRGFKPEYMTSCRKKVRYHECSCFDIRYNMDTARVFAVSKMRYAK